MRTLGIWVLLILLMPVLWVGPVSAITLTDSLPPASDLLLPFEDQVVGRSSNQVVTITNEGPAPLTLGTIGGLDPLVAPYRLDSVPCSNLTLAPGEVCTMTITFAPTTPGPFPDTFDIPSNDPSTPRLVFSVRGSGIPVPVPKIKVSDSLPPPQDLSLPFGERRVGTQFNQSVTISNVGNAPLVLGQIPAGQPLAPPFNIGTDNCSNRALAPNETCLFALGFAPSVVGVYSASVTIPHNDPNGGVVTLSLRGTAIPVPVPDIRVSDSLPPANDLSLPFGEHMVGSQFNQSVSISNVGSAPLVLGLMGGGQPLASPFSLGTDSCSNRTLALNETCVFALGFAPTSIGNFNARVAIPSNDPDAGQISLSLSGTAIPVPVPDIQVSDSLPPANDLSLPFGERMVGTLFNQSVSISNVGNAPLRLGLMAGGQPLASPFSLGTDSCSNRTLAPNETCVFALGFAPSSVGIFNARVTIPSNDPDAGQISLSLSGTAIPVPVPDIQVSDSLPPANDLSLPFGENMIGTRFSQSVTIVNAGTANLVLGQAGGGVPLAPPFTLGTDSCFQHTLAPSETCTFSLAFVPTSIGSFSTSLVIPSNDPDTGLVSLSLSGTATAVPVPDIALSIPGAAAGSLELNFADRLLGSTGTEQVLIGNVGTAPLQLGQIGADLPAGASFRLGVDGCSGQTLAPGQNCSLSLIFGPTAPGSQSTSLAIPSNDPDENPLLLILTGTALPAEVNRPPSAAQLLSPSNGQTGVPTSFTFVWSSSVDPDNHALLYKLYYDTSPTFANASPVVLAAAPWPGSAAGPALLLGLVLPWVVGKGRRRWLLLAVILAAACGSLDSGDSGNGAQRQVSVDVSGLAPATVYYWKVVSDDGQPGGEVASEIYSFRTR